MSLEEKFRASLADLDLPDGRRETAEDVVEAVAAALEGPNPDADSVAEAARQVVDRALVGARETVDKAEEVAS